MARCRHRGLVLADGRGDTATLAWVVGLVVLARSEISVSDDGILRITRLRTQHADLENLRWVAPSREAPEPRTADARGYQQWVVMLGDADGCSAVIDGTVPFPVWTRSRELLRIIVGAVEASDATISERNWSFLRRVAGMDPCPVPRSSEGADWVHRFDWNPRTAGKVSFGIALVGIWPIVMVLVAALGGLTGIPTLVALGFGAIVVGYAWRHRVVAARRRFVLHPDGSAEAVRRVGHLKLRLVEERVDLSSAVHVEARRVREVVRQGFQWTLTVHDAAGACAVLPLGECLIPPARYWAQASELLERSGVELPEQAAGEIARLVGRRPSNPIRPDAGVLQVEQAAAVHNVRADLSWFRRNWRHERRSSPRLLLPTFEIPHAPCPALALSALLVLSAVPANATDDHEEEGTEPELVECENPDDLEVITREGLESDIATPSFLVGNEYEYKDFLLDLSPATANLQGNLTTTMEWTVQANDYDLSVYSSQGSVTTEDHQPFDPPVEQATIPARHCGIIEVAAIDWLAPVVVDSLELTFSVNAPDVPNAPTGEPTEDPTEEPTEEPSEDPPAR